MRRRGSARFDPYFKAQQFDEITLSWRDVQRSFPTADDAAAFYADQPGRWRTVRVSETGRDIVASHPPTTTVQ